jgi:hypothetical protein
MLRRHGSRRYPPALFTYGTDTYIRLIFEVLVRHVPSRVAHWLSALERRLAGPVYALVASFVNRAQGYDSDGWVCRRAYFLLRRSEAAKALTITGHILPRRFKRSGLRLTATMNGTRLESRVVHSDGRFETRWTIPTGLRGDLMEVRLDSRPTRRPSWIPLRGDRRRLAFRLEEISFV